MKLHRAVRRAIETRDHMNFDQATIDSTGSFVVGQLERLDPTINMPLVNYTWGRDMPIRTDVSMGDESSSFSNSNFASTNGVPGSNKAIIGKVTNQIVNVQLDMGKTIQNLALWGVQVGWTLPELASAIALNKSLDVEKIEVQNLKYQMDMDELTYMGESVLGMNGLLNHASITNVGNAVNGTWAGATAAQVMGDVNEMLMSAWQLAAYSEFPNKILMAPKPFAFLTNTIVSTAGNQSLLQYLRTNNIATNQTGQPLLILPCKWLVGTNNGGQGPTATDSMFAYNQNKRYVRLPIVPRQRTPIEYRDLQQKVTYFARFGGVELIYPETVVRRSNLG